MWGYLDDGCRGGVVYGEEHERDADVDAEGRTLSIEFLRLNTFSQYIDEHGGLNLPERFVGPQSLVPSWDILSSYDPAASRR